MTEITIKVEIDASDARAFRELLFQAAGDLRVRKSRYGITERENAQLNLADRLLEAVQS